MFTQKFDSRDSGVYEILHVNLHEQREDIIEHFEKKSIGNSTIIICLQFIC